MTLTLPVHVQQGPAAQYTLDLSHLTAAQHRQLVAHLAHNHHLAPDAVARLIARDGVALLIQPRPQPTTVYVYQAVAYNKRQDLVSLGVSPDRDELQERAQRAAARHHYRDIQTITYHVQLPPPPIIEPGK